MIHKKRLIKLGSSHINKDPRYAGPEITTDPHLKANEKYQEWEQNIVPLWQERNKKMERDPKVQKFKSLITQAEGERKQKLEETFTEYLNQTHPTIYDADGELQGLTKLRNRAERHDNYPSERLTGQGAKEYYRDLTGNGIEIGSLLGGLGGAIAGGAIGNSEFRDIKGTLGSAGIGAGYGLLGGALLGGAGGALSGPILQSLGRPKDKSNYNKRGRINNLGQQIENREEYLNQGYDYDW